MNNTTSGVDRSSHADVIGILLAAGTSSRFEAGNKLLVTVDGTPIIQRAAQSLVAAAVDPVLVVVGHEADMVRDTLADSPVDIVENPRYDDGQSTSVQRAIESIPKRVSAAVFALGDMPYVDSTSIDMLVDAYHTGAGTALAAAYDGTRGNPVLFDRSHFEELVEIDGDAGGRSILRREGVLIETDDPGVCRDVDRLADLNADDRYRS